MTVRVIWAPLLALLAITQAVLGQSVPCEQPASAQALGTGTAGGPGVPTLMSVGLPLAGQPRLEVEVAGGRPGQPGVLVVSTKVEPVDVPSVGAVLYPAAPFRTVNFAFNDAGKAVVDLRPLLDPGAVPCGSYLVAQAGVADPFAQGGFAVTAALELTTGGGPAGTSAPVIQNVPEITAAQSVLVHGHGAAPLSEVRIEGGASVVEVIAGASGRFQATVPLKLEAAQTLFVRSIGVEGSSSPAAVAHVTQDGSPPLLIIEFPEDGALLSTSTTNV